MKITQITETETTWLKEYFNLDERTGRLSWKQKVARKVVIGNEAGSFRKDGYGTVQLFGKTYLVHRIIYAFVHGACLGEVDHINRDPSDNRPENLRPATRSQQNMNRSVQSNNTSGARGVYWFKPKGYWAARIKVQKRYICLGYFNTIEQATRAYLHAAEKHHGEFRGAY
jgi:hypothetical protein